MLLQIKIRSCQHQTGGDCGIYTVTNAFYILSGNDMSNTKIDERRMRAHFLQCLELGTFKPLLCFRLERLPQQRYYLKCPVFRTTLKIQI